MGKQITYKPARELVRGDLMDYSTRDAAGKRETAEVTGVTVSGAHTVVTYLDREREPETIHFASTETVKVVLRPGQTG